MSCKIWRMGFDLHERSYHECFKPGCGTRGTITYCTVHDVTSLHDIEVCQHKLRPPRTLYGTPTPVSSRHPRDPVILQLRPRKLRAAQSARPYNRVMLESWLCDKFDQQRFVLAAVLLVAYRDTEMLYSDTLYSTASYSTLYPDVIHGL